VVSEEETLVEQVVASFSPKIDATPLAKFDGYKDEIEQIDLASGPQLMRKFIHAYEWTSRAAINVRKRLDDADEEMKHEEAKALLERFNDYYEAHKDKLGEMKDSASLRKIYLSLDEPYRKAVAKVNMLKAMSKFLENKAESYRMAHDDSKKIYDKLLGRVEPGSGSYGTPGRAKFGDVSD